MFAFIFLSFLGSMDVTCQSVMFIDLIWLLPCLYNVKVHCIYIYVVWRDNLLLCCMSFIMYPYFCHYPVLGGWRVIRVACSLAAGTSWVEWQVAVAVVGWSVLAGHTSCRHAWVNLGTRWCTRCWCWCRCWCLEERPPQQTAQRQWLANLRLGWATYSNYPDF